MDSESDSIASDDGSGKKEPVKKPVFVKRKSNESAEETIKSVAAKNPFSMAQSKRSNTAELNKRKTDGVNLNISKKPNVVSRSVAVAGQPLKLIKPIIISWTFDIDKVVVVNEKKVS